MMRESRSRAFAWVLFAGPLGCTRWESDPVPMTAGPVLTSSVRVWTSGRAATVLAQPFVRHDTLYGRSRGDTLGIAVATIEWVERPRLDGLRTAGAVVGGLSSWITLGLLSGGWE
jgi:hypothetical protein